MADNCEICGSYPSVPQQEINTVADIADGARLVDEAIAHAIAEDRARIVRHIEQKVKIECEFVRKALLAIAEDIQQGKIAE